jgi:hypothetical protein
MPGEKEMNKLSGRLSSGVRSALSRTRRAQDILKRPTTLLLILVLLFSSLVPILLDANVHENKAGTIIGSDATVDPSTTGDTTTDQPSGDASSGSSGDTTSGTSSDSPTSEPSGAPTTSAGTGTNVTEVTPPVTETSGYDDFATAAASSNLTVKQVTGGYTIWAQEYSISVVQKGKSVQYEIRPYFTNDVIRYGRLDPMNSGEGTNDEYGNTLDWVTTQITDTGRSGNTVWFTESCAQYSLVHEFTIYRDYFELDVTYIPGTANVITTYVIALYSSSGQIYNLFSDGVAHRYIPGVPEETSWTNGIGGWFPAYQMFAPAFDMRVPGRTLGVEWGYDETEAYLYSPIWMKGMTVDGSSAFGVKYTSTGSVLPDPSLGSAKTWHMFVRPYEYTDGEPRGHDAGYAKWVAPLIAESWGYQSSPQFPLTFNDFGQYINGQSGSWDAATRSWIESSPILVATLSKNANQVNWNYKSAQQMLAQSGAMPTAWQLWNSPGHAYTMANGNSVASAASAAYRNYLISGDPYNDWWWSTTGVFWDEMNSWYGENNLPRSDYNTARTEFIYEGYLRLVQESRASGHWNFVLSNPYTAQIQLAMLSDLTVVEGFEPVSSYGIDMTDIVQSMMEFVNEMPTAYRPHLLVYQNYNAESSADQAAVYSVLFNSARYGFNVDLLSYASYSAQMHNLQMAVKMYQAMGADRRVDPTNWPATLDMTTEGHSITTDRSMVVFKGSGNLAIQFTDTYSTYSLTNLGSSAVSFTMTLPQGSYAVTGTGITKVSVETLSDGRTVFHGIIAAEATAGLKNSNVTTASSTATQSPAGPLATSSSVQVSNPMERVAPRTGRKEDLEGEDLEGLGPAGGAVPPALDEPEGL